MSCATSYTGNRKWLHLCNNIPEHDALTDDVQEDLKNDFGTKFIGWLLWHVTTTGNKGKMQMFYVTFCAHFFGLSRQGIHLMSRYGYGVTVDMFDDIRKSYEERSISNTRSVCVMMYDERLISIVL